MNTAKIYPKQRELIHNLHYMNISKDENMDNLKPDKSKLDLGDEQLVNENEKKLSPNSDTLEALSYAASIIASIRQPLLILDKDLNVKSANNNFYKTFLVNELEVLGRSIFEIENGQWNIPELRHLLEKVLPQKIKVKDLEVIGIFNNLRKRIMLLNANEIINKSTTEKLILLAIEDVSERRQLEEKEKDLNEIFMNMVVNAPVAMMVLRGPSHIVDIINAPALKLLGKTDVELLKLRLVKAIPTLVNSEYLEILNRVFRTGERYEATEQKVNLKHLGKYAVCYLNLVFDPFKNNLGSITGVVAICNDVTAQVTARKKIEENELKFQLIADFMPEKIWTTKADGNTDYFNKRFLEYSGLNFEEIQKWGWQKIIHLDDWPENERLWKESVSTGKDFEFMHRFLNTKGEYRWHLSRSLPLKDEAGNILMWVGASTEIHSVKEEEEKRANFIKMVSHELKTPVTSIKGYVQLLQMLIENDKDINLPEPATSSLIRINNLVDRLTRLIREMLDLSRLDSGQMEFHEENFNLLNLIIETVKDMQQTNPKHIIKITEEFACEVKGDKNQLEQLMVNLIGNAIKYSKEGSQILISVKQQSDFDVEVSVKDEGIGIEPKDQAKIFERFYRVSGKNEMTYPGFGIGLFICKEIVERHGGTISLQSEKNEGAVFTFTLPLK